jgi:two-component system nitrogen regulation sensor histidine kinase NtrY
MNSLRVRLILGLTLLALVPLAIAIILLTDRLERMVRGEAADRVSAALTAVTSQLAEDQRRTVEKVQILARDPDLSQRLRLVPLEGGLDLADFLEQRRFLLGLDFLRVTDPTGNSVRADAADAVSSSDSTRRATRPAPAEPPRIRAISLRTLIGGQGFALIASAPIQYRGQVTGHLEGGFALDDEFFDRWRARTGIDLAIRKDPPFGNTIPLNPTSNGNWGRSRWVSVQGARINEAVPLTLGDPPYATLAGGASTDESEKTITSLQWASGILGFSALAIAILLGFAWSRQITRPVKQIAEYSEQLARGEWDEPLQLRSVRELETLVSALDRMRQDLRSYRERLVVSERQAAWSQMARKVAHEVKNPLTPIAVSVADLKRSYEAGRPDFPAILDQAVRTIGEEVETLKRLLQEFSDFGRFPPPRIEPSRWAGIAADLEILYGKEIAAGRLAVSSDGRSLVFPADAGQIRQALVNLIRNGLDAAGDAGHVRVSAAAHDSTAVLTVSDDGPGLTPEQKERLFTPGFTTKTHGSGLGLTIVERIVLEHGGAIDVQSASGRGTDVTIRLPLSRKES